jgi:hypothetical protein
VIAPAGHRATCGDAPSGTVPARFTQAPARIGADELVVAAGAATLELLAPLGHPLAQSRIPAWPCRP